MAALADLPDLVARLSAALTAMSLPHAVSEAMAMAAHGFVRATRDIDFLVVVPALRLPEVFAVVRQAGFEGRDEDLIRSLRERAVATLVSGGPPWRSSPPSCPTITRSSAGQGPWRSAACRCRS